MAATSSSGATRRQAVRALGASLVFGCGPAGGARPPTAADGTVPLGPHPSFAAVIHGRVAVIDFWATWCGPCVVETPALVRMYDKYKNKGFAVVGVADRTTQLQQHPIDLNAVDGLLVGAPQASVRGAARPAAKPNAKFQTALRRFAGVARAAAACAGAGVTIIACSRSIMRRARCSIARVPPARQPIPMRATISPLRTPSSDVHFD